MSKLILVACCIGLLSAFGALYPKEIGGTTELLPLHQRDSVSVISFSQTDAYPIRAKSTDNSTSDSSNIRGVGCRYVAHDGWWTSFMRSPLGWLLQILAGGATGLFICVKWLFPLVEKYFE